MDNLNTNNLIAPGIYNKVNNFDFIRIVLAFMVVFHHIISLKDYNSSLLNIYLIDLAVNSFFIISGLLVMWSFDNNRKLIGYWLKRFFRIYPLYFFIIVIQLCLLLILTRKLFNFELLIDSVKYFIANIIFLNFLQPTIPGVFENLKYNVINGSLWTIKIEVLFYLFLPCIYYLIKKFGIKSLVFLYFFSASAFIITKLPLFAVLADQFPTQLRFFIIGIMLYLYGYKIRFSFFSSLLILVFFTASFFYDNSIIYRAFIYPIFLGFTIYLAGFCNRIINIKYDISYCVYVIHFPVIQLLLFFNYSVYNPYLFIITVLIIVVLLSFLSSIFLERKFIKLGHSLTSS